MLSRLGPKATAKAMAKIKPGRAKNTSVIRISTSSIIPPYMILPAVGQGALGIEISSANNLARQAVSAIHDEETFIAVLAEREFLRILEGGCQVPIGAYAEVKANGLYEGSKRQIGN